MKWLKRTMAWLGITVRSQGSLMTGMSALCQLQKPAMVVMDGMIGCGSIRKNRANCVMLQQLLAQQDDKRYFVWDELDVLARLTEIFGCTSYIG